VGRLTRTRTLYAATNLKDFLVFARSLGGLIGRKIANRPILDCISITSQF